MSWIDDNLGGFIALVSVLGVLLLLVLIPQTRDRTLAILATVYLWVAFWGSHLVCFIVQCLLLVTVVWWAPDVIGQKLLGRSQQITILPLVNLNPFWWLKVHRRCKGGIPRGCIIMPNHLSYVDSWLVAAAVFPVAPRFVAMAKLFSMPLLGQVMRLAGHIPVYFAKREDGTIGIKPGSSDEIMARAKWNIENGVNLVVFPEGSLSYSGELKDFKLGFFRLALELQCPIVPIGQWGNSKMFPPGDQFAMAHVARVHVNIGDPVQAADFDTPEAMRDHVKEQVRQLRDSLPNFDLYKNSDVEQGGAVAPAEQ